MNACYNIFWICLVGLVVGGCGPNLPSTVSGKVTLDQKILTSGNVTFHPVSAGVVAYGQIDANGYYTLQTGSGSGLNVGDYMVTVIATEPVEVPVDPKVPPVPPKAITPLRYNSATESGLRFSVKLGANTFDLDLTSE